MLYPLNCGSLLGIRLQLLASLIPAQPRHNILELLCSILAPYFQLQVITPRGHHFLMDRLRQVRLQSGFALFLGRSDPEGSSRNLHSY